MTTIAFPLPDSTSASPFDRIRHVRDDGTEYWSARDLMPLMGYSRWNEFQAVIERSIQSITAQGLDPDEVFRVNTENPSEQGGRPRKDFRMIRYGCYLVALNGDPRKPESAVAQAYFVTKTRQAEIQAVDFSGYYIPPDYISALRLAADQCERADRAEVHLAIVGQHTVEQQHRIETLAPKADAFDTFLNGTGLYYIATAARMLGIGATTFFTMLYDEKILIRGGPRHREPFAKYGEWFRVIPHDEVNTNGHLATTTMFTPAGFEACRQLLIRRGRLTPGTGLVTS